MYRKYKLANCWRGRMASSSIAPYLRTPLPACSIVVDRHVHKNGGSTVRELFLRNELHDGWLYWGYGLAHTQRVVAGLIELLLGPPNRSCTDWSRRPALRLVAFLAAPEGSADQGGQHHNPYLSL